MEDRWSAARQQPRTGFADRGPQTDQMRKEDSSTGRGYNRIGSSRSSETVKCPHLNTFLSFPACLSSLWISVPLCLWVSVPLSLCPTLSLGLCLFSLGLPLPLGLCPLLSGSLSPPLSGSLSPSVSESLFCQRLCPFLSGSLSFLKVSVSFPVDLCPLASGSLSCSVPVLFLGAPSQHPSSFPSLHVLVFLQSLLFSLPSSPRW